LKAIFHEYLALGVSFLPKAFQIYGKNLWQTKVINESSEEHFHYLNERCVPYVGINFDLNAKEQSQGLSLITSLYYLFNDNFQTS